ncbi:MAG: trigger factor [Alphaproteobacteria bacterium]
MQLIEINTEGLKREYKVTLPAADMAARVDARLGELARTVRLPGFRPGKVTPKVVRQRFGKSVTNEVRDAVIGETVGKVITERGLRPALEPKVDGVSFEAGGDLEFTLALEVLPDVGPIDFSELVIERVKAEVEDAEIDRGLERLAKQRTRTEAVAEPRDARPGDTVVIDFAGSIAGAPIVGGSGQDYRLELGSNTFVPGFEDALLGSRPGDNRIFPVTFPDNYHSDLAGKQAEFSVTVRELHEPVPVAIDDDLAKFVGAESLEDLRKSVRGALEQRYAEVSRQRAKRAVLDRLAELHTFEVPAGMVDREFEGIWEQFEVNRAQGRVDPTDRGRSDDDLKTEYRALSLRRVRLGILLAEVGRQNNITVMQEDLNRALAQEARRYPGQEKLVLDYYRKSDEAMASLRAPILEEKAIDFLLEMAKITDRTVSAEELMKDDEAENTGEKSTGAESEASA